MLGKATLNNKATGIAKTRLVAATIVNLIENDKATVAAAVGSTKKAKPGGS